MTGQDAAGSRARAETIAREAQAAAATAVERIALQVNGAAATGTPCPGTATALRVARRLELAARMETVQLVKTARADGMGWREIGALLGLGPDAIEDGVSVAEAAFSFAAGRHAADTWDVAVFWWTCPACGETVSDRGPGHGHPQDAEPGHAGDCQRLAAAVAASGAQWTRDG